MKAVLLLLAFTAAVVKATSDACDCALESIEDILNANQIVAYGRLGRKATIELGVKGERGSLEGREGWWGGEGNAIQ